MKRVKFLKGEQRKFLKRAMKFLNCLTLIELSNRMGINYSTLKNYFSEKRLLGLEFFEDICFISKIDKKSLNFELLNENFGQIFGGKKSCSKRFK
jgi:hypothetical protein